MTQDEIDLIYDYLHENYEYKEGELIRIKDSRGKRKGELFGYFESSRKLTRIIGTIYINKVKYTLRLSVAIYLYFHKVKPRYVSYLDNNPANNRIENLVSVPAKRIIRSGMQETRKYKTYTTKKGLIRYYPLLNINGVTNGICACDSEEDAIRIYDLANNLYLNNNFDLVQIKFALKNEIKNARTQRFNQYGFKGVTRSGKKYHGTYMVNGKARYTEAFTTPEEAHKAYLQAKKELNK